MVSLKPVEVFCKICDKNIVVEVDEDEIKNSPMDPTTITFVHGDPTHTLTLYLDKNLFVRGIDTSRITSVEPGRIEVEERWIRENSDLVKDVKFNYFKGVLIIDSFEKRYNDAFAPLEVMPQNISTLELKFENASDSGEKFIRLSMLGEQLLVTGSSRIRLVVFLKEELRKESILWFLELAEILGGGYRADMLGAVLSYLDSCILRAPRHGQLSLLRNMVSY
ncbi:MAG: hypothetical protein ACETVN_05375 [Asgard group archaeon]